MIKFRYLRYLPHCRKYCLYFHLDLGMKILTDLEGLDKSFKNTKPYVNL